MQNELRHLWLCEVRLDQSAIFSVKLDLSFRRRAVIGRFDGWQVSCKNLKTSQKTLGFGQFRSHRLAKPFPSEIPPDIPLSPQRKPVRLSRSSAFDSRANY